MSETETTSEVQSSPLHLKLSAILGSVGGIPKTGYNKFQNYNYVHESDVLDAIRPLLARDGIAVYVNIIDVDTKVNVYTSSSGTPQHLTIVQGEIVFVDAISNESVSFGIAGQGMDSGDKGLPKAITMAVKYGLMKSFLLGTGDDAEVPAEHEGPTTQVTPLTAPSRSASPADAESTPPATRTPQEGAAESPYPWDEDYTAEAATAAAPTPPPAVPARSSGREISDKQRGLVFARAKAANLSDAERDEIITRISGQKSIEGIQWGDQLDEILEAFAAFGAHKAAQPA